MLTGYFKAEDKGIVEWSYEEYVVSTDKTRLDLEYVHDFLSRRSYWAVGIPRAIVEQSIRNTLTFGLFAPSQKQIGFAKVITDYALFAYLNDVFVEESHRGRGLGTWLCACGINHPDLKTVRRWMLSTDDAHAVYAKLGFEPLPNSAIFMQRVSVSAWGRKSPEPAGS